MANVLLVILLIISVILIGLILIQRSEGGALGIGGSGGAGGGLMSGRGTADMVSRMTAIFGTAFLIVSLLISISFNIQNRDKEILTDKNAVEELVKDVNNSNKVLNDGEISDKDTTPLVEDSKAEESDAISENGSQEQSQIEPKQIPQD